MTAAAAVLRSLVGRSWTALVRIPAAIIPAIAMPVFFTVAFSGTFRSLTMIPGFPTDQILNWMVPYSCLQGASFAGLGSIFGLGRDIESGFHDRLLLSPAPRWSIAGAPVAYSAMRSLVPIAIVLPLGAAGGLSFPGGPVAVLLLVVASMAVGGLATLWGMGVVYRMRSQRAGGLAQVGLFTVMFLSTGTMPVDLQRGWLPHVARFNPVTPILDLARAGFLGGATWAEVWPGLVAIVGAALALGWWAQRGFRRLLP